MRRALPSRLLRGGRRNRWLLLLALVSLLIALVAVEQFAFSRNQTPRYEDASFPAASRVDDLLGRMTLAEKVGQLAQVHVAKLNTEIVIDKVFKQEAVGSILSGGGESPGPGSDPTAWAEGINSIQKAALERSRLGIPILYGADAPHGLSPVLGAVIFPQQIGIGATRNAALARQLAAATARSARAVGIRWIFGPVADVSRDLRWGRFYETYSEDPKLASTLVAATVHGLQDGAGDQLQVAATAKHFIGYSQPAGGRDRYPVVLSSSTLRQWFVPPFQAAVDAGVASVMTQHGAVNGTPVVGSRALSTVLLRRDMGFRGVLLSDWGDVESLNCWFAVGCIATSPSDAVRQAFNAGLDVSMIPDNSHQFTSDLIDLVKRGEVSQARLDEAVRRVLTLKFELGLFEQPYVDVGKAKAAVEAKSDRPLARKIADASMTLLENRKHVLPLTESGKPVLVVGQPAEDVSWQMGGWTIGWQGLPMGVRPPAVTILQGMRETLGARNVITEANWEHSAAVRAKAKKARAVVVVIGEKPYAEWYGDKPKAELPPDQVKLAKVAEATGKPVVLVLVAGRPLMIGDLIKKSDAFLMAYLPGTETGHAVADVLFGRVAPKGKLPFSWPASIKDVPMVKGVRLSDGKRAKTLFAYGAGLSYR